MAADQSEAAKLKLRVQWPEIFSALGVIFSLIALTQSCEQTSASKKIPFEASLYQTRVSAMQSYARSHYNLDNQIRATLADIPYDIYSPEGLAATKDFGMQHNAVVAQKFRDQYAAYIAEMNANMGIWPTEVQTKLVNAGDLASAASACFLELGGKTMTNGTYSEEQHRLFWRQVRFRAERPCHRLNVTHSANGLNYNNPIVRFQRAGHEVLSLMADTLRKTQDDLVPETQ